MDKVQQMMLQAAELLAESEKATKVEQAKAEQKLKDLAHADAIKAREEKEQTRINSDVEVGKTAINQLKEAQLQLKTQLESIRNSSTATDKKVVDLTDSIRKQDDDQNAAIAALEEKLACMKRIPDPDDIANDKTYEFERNEVQTKYNEIEGLLFEKHDRDIARLKEQFDAACAKLGVDLEDPMQIETAASGGAAAAAAAASAKRMDGDDDGGVDLDGDGDAIVINTEEAEAAESASGNAKADAMLTETATTTAAAAATATATAITAITAATASAASTTVPAEVVGAGASSSTTTAMEATGVGLSEFSSEQQRCLSSSGTTAAKTFDFIGTAAAAGVGNTSAVRARTGMLGVAAATAAIDINANASAEQPTPTTDAEESSNVEIIENESSPRSSVAASHSSPDHHHHNHQQTAAAAKTMATLPPTAVPATVSVSPVGNNVNATAANKSPSVSPIGSTAPDLFDSTEKRDEDLKRGQSEQHMQQHAQQQQQQQAGFQQNTSPLSSTSTSSTSSPLGNSSNSSSSGAGAPAPTTAASAILPAVFDPSAQRVYLSGPATSTPMVRHNNNGDGASNSSAFPHGPTLYAKAAAQVHDVAKQQQPQHYKQANQHQQHRGAFQQRDQNTHALHMSNHLRQQPRQHGQQQQQQAVPIMRQKQAQQQGFASAQASPAVTSGADNNDTSDVWGSESEDDDDDQSTQEGEQQPSSNFFNSSSPMDTGNDLDGASSRADGSALW